MVRALANLLRGTASSTSADVLAESVREARRWLAFTKASDASGATLESRAGGASLTIFEDDEEGPVPLTRRRSQKPTAGA
ncbi:MAG: hypothetical protein H5U40_17795 [Polyangiaceae bacterium]|nr:hypothetical protein [Polyangiaceae bacterium]